MKTTKTFGILMALLALAGCSNNEFSGEKQGKKVVEMTFKASTEGRTRTILTPESGNVTWKAGDKLSVFADGETYMFMTTQSGAEVDFNGSCEEATRYYALYPGNYDATITSENKIKSTLPSTQTATLNSFDPEANLSVGISSNKSFQMRNVGGLVKFTIPDDLSFSVAEVKFQGHNNEVLAGDIYIEPGTTPKATPSADSGSKTSISVKLKPETGNKIAPGTYYIAVLPDSLKQGFSITFKGTNNALYTKSYNGIVAIARSHIVNIGTISNFDIQSVDLGLSVRWANCNIGANAPEEYGNYYMWGELTEKPESNHESYKFCIDNATNLSKYNSTDNIKVLEPEDDVAHVVLGDSWRMPTWSEINELTTSPQIQWEWATVNGKKCYKITSNVTHESIYLPLAGFIQKINNTSEENTGMYWSSSVKNNSGGNDVYCILIQQGQYPSIQTYERYYGRSVRAVAPYE